MLAMKQLLDHTVEVFALWKVLCDRRLLAQSLQTDLRMSLKTMLFRDLILSGGDTCGGLINLLIHSYLHSTTSFDEISEKFRQVFPSLYRNKEAPSTKFNEQLFKAPTADSSSADDLEKILKNELNVKRTVLKMSGNLLPDGGCKLREEISDLRKSIGKCKAEKAEKNKKRRARK